MAFSKWMTFLVSLACAIYGCSPEEINFESFAASKSSMSGSDTAEKISSSKDIGLRPVMAHYEATISDYVISSFGDKYCFRWVGLDEEDPKTVWERKKLTATLDELRAEDNREAYPIAEMGDIPMNPAHIAAWTQLKLAPQQPAGDFGDPGAEPVQAPGAGQEPGDFGQGDGEPSGDAPEGEEQGQGGQPADFGGAPAAPGGEKGDFGKSLPASLAEIYSAIG